ncbi:hypothetical protein GCM10011581_43440 [Saccharopolyspora subtropica]|uniref:Uncharacterized protein n=2 Tax=Saccharopolyspora thermophila TaxID=89367 RepID=A0A917K5H9_9PSEU|nr:hypothetical protein GCM10011581_43440 [Saccharopolyspora subtropica]
MDRGAWAFGIHGLTYVWPGGEVVQVFGFVEYVRRLAGEVDDARPFAFIPVRGFTTMEEFQTWCRSGPGQHEDEGRCSA